MFKKPSIRSTALHYIVTANLGVALEVLKLIFI